MEGQEEELRYEVLRRNPIVKLTRTASGRTFSESARDSSFGGDIAHS